MRYFGLLNSEKFLWFRTFGFLVFGVMEFRFSVFSIMHFGTIDFSPGIMQI